MKVTPSVSRDHLIGEFYFVVGFREIEIIGNALLKVVNRLPCDKCGGSGSAGIYILGLDCISQRLAIFVIDYELVHELISDDRSQLLSRIGLSFVGDTPLLENEPVTYNRSGNQEKRENSDRTSSADHFLVKPGIGWGLLALVGWLSWSAISHFIYSERRGFIIARSVAKMAIAIVSLWMGLYLL